MQWHSNTRGTGASGRQGRWTAILLRFVIAGSLLSGATRCALAGAGCPCGGDPEAPLGEHDLTYAGRHVVATGCVCQCGTDSPTQRERNGDLCPDDGRECVDDARRTQTYACY